MNLYQKIRAAISKRRRGPNTLTEEELEWLKRMGFDPLKNGVFRVENHTTLEIVDRLGWEAARDRQAVEGLTDFETIEFTGYYPR